MFNCLCESELNFKSNLRNQRIVTSQSDILISLSGNFEFLHLNKKATTPINSTFEGFYTFGKQLKTFGNLA